MHNSVIVYMVPVKGNIAYYIRDGKKLSYAGIKIPLKVAVHSNARAQWCSLINQGKQS